MLNKVLYDALARAFNGDVVIENQDVEADIERVYNDPRYTTSWVLGVDHGEQYRVNCPFCVNDSNHHLYISYLSFVRPVRDGEELNTCGLLAHCFRRDCIAVRDNYDRLASMIMQGMQNHDPAHPIKLTYGTAMNTQDKHELVLSHKPTVEGIRDWVADYTPCESYMPYDVRDYLFHRRGLSYETVLRYKLGWGQVRTPYTGKLLNGGARFILVPVVMNGRLVGVQARSIDNTTGLRYWTHPAMSKSLVLFNIDMAKQLGLAVLCEGVFDAMKVGPAGVCMFGHKPSSRQKDMLGLMKEGVIILPDTDKHDDFDTVQEAHQLADELRRSYGKRAAVIVLPAKDPGEMGRDMIWINIITQLLDQGDRLLSEGLTSFIQANFEELIND